VFTLVLVIYIDKVRNFATARRTPTCPEIYEYILTLTYIVGEFGCLAIISSREVLEHVTSLLCKTS
jgi:hypothetical protein